MKITNPQNISGNPLLSQVAVSGGHLSGAGTSASPLTVGGYVETTTTVNDKALSSNVTITALDVPMSTSANAISVSSKFQAVEQLISGKANATHSHVVSEVTGVVPSSRTVNGKALSSNVVITALDVKMTSANDAPTVQAKISSIEQQITGGGEVTVSPITYNDNPISSIVAGSNVSMTYSAGALTVNATATQITVDAGISSNSTNPVQNRAVYSALESKANASHSHTIAEVSSLSNSLGSKITMPTNGSSGYYLEKTGASTVTWRLADSSLNATSTRPVQNKTVYAKTSAIEASVSSIDGRVSSIEQQLDGIAALLSGI